MTKKIAILGSTGSIGTQALQVIEEHSDLYEAYVLTANRSAGKLIEQARRFKPEAVVIADETFYESVRDALADLPIKVYAGANALCEVVQDRNVDIVLASMVGFAGLMPTISAIKAGKAIALANKETLVISDVKNFVTSISQSFNDYISDAFLKFKSKDKDSIFLKRSFLSTVWCKIIPKNLIGEKRFDVRFKIGEDALFMFAISQGIKRIVLSDDAIYYRRCRNGSVSRTKQSIRFRLSNSIMQILEYTRIYIQNPFKYNFLLFLSRIVASAIHIVK